MVPEQRGRGLSDYAEDVSRYSLLQYVEECRASLLSWVCGGCRGGYLDGRADDLCAERAVSGSDKACCHQ